MRGIAYFLRRARRLSLISVWSGLYRKFQWTAAPEKHIKIDDEEQLLDEAEYAPFGSQARSPLLNVLKMIFLALLALFVLVVIVAYIIYKPPNFLISFLQRKNPDVLFHVSIPSSQRVVALTLDDAPSSETAKILDVLKTYDAKATFFIIGGQVSNHPSLLERIHDEGHEVGNHAWADEPSINLPVSELERQMKEVETMLPVNRSGAKYFRPGSGFFNKAMVEMAKKLGYKMILGDIFPHDPFIHNARINAAHVLSMVRPGGIIIMHDRRSYSADQVERVLRGLSEEGWRVESLGGLLKIASEFKTKGG